jgi:class 3 adenylate cyclase/tetratricopeptide (TPR) repeat protein
MTEIRRWLDSIGLSEYAKVFAENAIDVVVLPELSDDDLKALGLPLGHRRKLQKALRGLDRNSAPGSVTHRPVESTPAGDAERRQLTIMFCDLVGSTELSQKLDPEELREINRSYQDTAKAAIERFDGFVARYMGDGVLAYFGYPQAHEDDPERAVRAALALIETVPAASTDRTLALRVGIATGSVVVGDLIGEGASQESAVVGETPNLAARLQGLADPDTVVVSSSTYQLLGSMFDVEDLGEHRLKGLSAPVVAYRVVAPFEERSRFEASQSGALTPLVGREEETQTLFRRWQQANSGEGCVVLVTGEPGIGKSRLAQALRERLDAQVYRFLRYQCSSYHTNTALYPIVDHLIRASRIAVDDAPADKLSKLEALLAQADEGLLSEASLYAELLSIPAADRHQSLGLTPQQKRGRMLNALIEQLRLIAGSTPVLLLFEDAHWSDPTTRELLDLMCEKIHAWPVLAVITFRPDFTPPWSGEAHVTSVVLNKLSPRTCESLIAKVAGGRALPAAITAQIIEKTDGVPLFIEELTKTIIESGALTETTDGFQLDSDLPSLTVPTTLQDSLMARLDRLGATKEVAQIGAVIGREFTHELLADVASLPDQVLSESLNQLIDVGLLYRRGTPPAATYVFKHALVQDTAYASLLKSRRREFHGAIANAFQTGKGYEPQVLAHHLTEAGLADQALQAWLEAARLAFDVFANAEAISHARQGLRLADTVDPTLEQKHQQLRLWVIAGGACRITKGFGSPESHEAFIQAINLAQELGQDDHFVDACRGLGIGYFSSARFAECHELMRRVESMAKKRNHRMIRRFVDGLSLTWEGDLAKARADLEGALALYDGWSAEAGLISAQADPWVNLRGHLSMVLALQGEIDTALTTANSAVARGEVSKAPIDVMQAHIFTIPTNLWCGLDIMPLVLRLHELAVERKAVVYELHADFYIGYDMALHGDTSGGIRLLRNALERYQGLSQIWMPIAATLISECMRLDGNYDEASSQLDDALDFMKRTGAYTHHPILLFHKGTTLLKQSRNNEAAARQVFIDGINTAKAQGNKLFQLRNATALAQLWLDKDQPQEARAVLEPVLESFREGHQTPNLMAARAVLASLD